MSLKLGQAGKPKSRETAKPQPFFGLFPEPPDHLLVMCWDLHNVWLLEDPGRNQGTGKFLERC